MSERNTVSIAGEDSSTDQTARLMSLIANSGRLEIRDRFFRLRRYRATFIGSELVDLLTEEYRIGRAEATRIGQRLLALELITHAHGEHDFKDEPLFYVLRTGKKQVAQPDLTFHAMRQLSLEMRRPGGINPGVRRRWFVDYPMCFSGSELVDWVCATAGLSRSQSVTLGQAMLRGNLIRHVLDDKPFIDGNHFYRFV